MITSRKAKSSRKKKRSTQQQIQSAINLSLGPYLQRMDWLLDQLERQQRELGRVLRSNRTFDYEGAIAEETGSGVEDLVTGGGTGNYAQAIDEEEDAD